MQAPQDRESDKALHRRPFSLRLAPAMDCNQLPAQWDELPRAEGLQSLLGEVGMRIVGPAATAADAELVVDLKLRYGINS
jgi:hypothetical protein